MLTALFLLRLVLQAIESWVVCLIFTQDYMSFAFSHHCMLFHIYGSLQEKKDFLFKFIFLKNKPISLYSIYSQHTDLQLNSNVCALLHHPVYS